jgi:hypothetical protein
MTPVQLAPFQRVPKLDKGRKKLRQKTSHQRRLKLVHLANGKAKEKGKARRRIWKKTTVSILLMKRKERQVAIIRLAQQMKDQRRKVERKADLTLLEKLLLLLDKGFLFST